MILIESNNCSGLFKNSGFISNSIKIDVLSLLIKELVESSVFSYVSLFLNDNLFLGIGNTVVLEMVFSFRMLKAFLFRLFDP